MAFLSGILGLTPFCNASLLGDKIPTSGMKGVTLPSQIKDHLRPQKYPYPHPLSWLLLREITFMEASNLGETNPLLNTWVGTLGGHQGTGGSHPQGGPFSPTNFTIPVLFLENLSGWAQNSSGRFLLQHEVKGGQKQFLEKRWEKGERRKGPSSKKILIPIKDKKEKKGEGLKRRGWNLKVGMADWVTFGRLGEKFNKQALKSDLQRLARKYNR
ncbi:hypothetical protein Tco_0469005 [Tanacetum coccineum]